MSSSYSIDENRARSESTWKPCKGLEYEAWVAVGPEKNREPGDQGLDNELTKVENIDPSVNRAKTT